MTTLLDALFLGANKISGRNSNSSFGLIPFPGPVAIILSGWCALVRTARLIQIITGGAMEVARKAEAEAFYFFST